MKSRVVIVDDNEMMQSFLQHILEPYFSVEILQNAEEALRFLKKVDEQPDVIVTDYHLEGMTGVDFLKKVRALPDKKYIAFVVLSGLKTYRDECLKAGADDFLTKPFIPAELRNRLHVILRGVAMKKTA